MAYDAPRAQDRVKRTMGRLGSDDRGTILALFAMVSIIVLALTGAVVDFGLAWVSKAQLSRAVDAGVLAGARSLRQGTGPAQAQALAIAEANGVSSSSGATVDLGFGTNAEGESTIWMTAARPIPTHFIKVIGLNQLYVGSIATAAVPPVDLVLVIDQSGSLGAVGAWDDLQAAARDFVDFFDDDLDQMGLVSFGTRAMERHVISSTFTTAIQNDITAMNSVGWTNYGEGLRLAHQQITSPMVRQRSVKVVVFFTDGRKRFVQRVPKRDELRCVDRGTDAPDPRRYRRPNHPPERTGPSGRYPELRGVPLFDRARRSRMGVS